MKKESGNALFLILIAVALFAALSYAVTQSGRGGSGVSKEHAEILAAQIVQDVGRMQSQIQRLKLIGGYDQVLFNDSAPNDSGTCYSGGSTTTPCKTIGLFSDESGAQLPIWTPEMRDPAYSNNWQWVWQTRRMLLNGVDYGTSAPDTLLNAYVIAPEICRALNRKLAGSSDVLSSSSYTETGSGKTENAYYDGLFMSISSVTTANQAVNMPYEGCIAGGDGRKYALFIIEEN